MWVPTAASAFAVSASHLALAQDRDAEDVAGSARGP